MKIEIEEEVLMQLAYEHAELATSESKQNIYEALMEWIEDKNNVILTDKLDFLIKEQDEKKDAIFKRYGIIRKRSDNVKVDKNHNEKHS